jgi:hypothetical protein
VLRNIKQIPVWIAVLVMIACIPVGVALGNHRALSRVEAGVTECFEEVSGLAYQRVDIIEHRLLVLCKRNIPADPTTGMLEQAIEASRRANSPHGMAQADLSLASAAESVLEPLYAVASSQDGKLATGVMDDFASVGKILSRTANTYNNSLQTVWDVYDRLPMKWLLGNIPEAYK